MSQASFQSVYSVNSCLSLGIRYSMHIGRETGAIWCGSDVKYWYGDDICWDWDGNVFGIVR